MKAKLYAEQYLESQDKREAISKIWISFVAEIADITETRKAQSSEAIRSILHEQNDKWNSFCRKINKKIDPTKHGVLLEDSFLKVFKERFPEIYHFANFK